MTARVIAVLATLVCTSPANADWVASWAASSDTAAPSLAGQSVRQIVRISLGGTRVRLRLSNLYGTAPLVIGPVHVARQAKGSAIEPGSDRAVTFAGKAVVTIAKGADVTSDPIAFEVRAFGHLSVSVYVAAGAGASTVHANAMQVAYIAPGDVTAAPRFPDGEMSSTRFFVDRIDVDAASGARAVVAFGDSITDGVGSTPEHDARWPDLLASRFAADPALAAIAVVNTGIAGNRILHDAAGPFAGHSALSRFDRDVASQPGARWVVFLEGINDIAASDLLGDATVAVSAKQLTDGLAAVAERAHAKNLKIAIATLLPYGGVEWPYRSAIGETKRLAVNAWIRSSKAFDAILDFERVTRDPAHPDRMLPAFDSGDHLHPSDAGYKAMAESIDVHLFSR